MGNQPSTTIAKQTSYGVCSLGTIVDYTINKKFNIDARVNGHKIFRMDQDPEDEIKPLKTVATDFVVNEMFQTESTLYKFLSVVYNNFDEVLSIYREKKNIAEKDLFFIYKGGNILRFVSHEFMRQIPASANDEISKFYAPFFKRSDADFAVFISPDLENYDEVHHDIGIIAYLVQDRIRAIFMNNPGEYFDFLRYSKHYKDKILREYLPKFNEFEGFKFKNLSFLESNANGQGERSSLSQPDFAIDFIHKVPTPEEEAGHFRMGIRKNIFDSGSFITISHNDALLFYTGVNKDRKSHFTLVRSKIFFTLTGMDDKPLKVGGELIDVGIDYTDDVKNIHLVDHFKSSIHDYEITYKDCTLKFKSYTISHLIYDLEEILFEKAKYPWDDPKYNKRINRLFYFYFVDAFLKIKTGDERIEMLRSFKNSILMKYKQKKNPNADIKKFRTKYSKYGLEIAHMLKWLPELNAKVDAESEAEMTKFIDLLILNANFLIGALEKIKNYCQYDGKVKSKDIYMGETSELL
jgi:hypothetical protein